MASATTDIYTNKNRTPNDERGEKRPYSEFIETYIFADNIDYKYLSCIKIMNFVHIEP